MRAAWRLLAVPLGAVLLLTGFSLDRSAPATETIALTGARLIDGTGRVPVEQATLIIRNGRIEAVGTAAAVAVPAGYFEHVELELKAGLTPMQALVAATGGAARVMKLDEQLGTLEPGKRADLVVLRGNPLSDIRNTRQLDAVWIAGREVVR
jgi:imidazolonepropionase-like amidohydrolase